MKNKLLIESFFYSIEDMKPSDQLYDKVWQEGSNLLKPEIRKKLLQIALDFVKQFNLKRMEVVDITFTGSLANYNWTPTSDIDLHVILDFKNIDENPSLAKNYFATKAKLWNLMHDIKIFNHDVEIYVQDLAEPHASTGIYSVFRNKWNKFPMKKTPEIDVPGVRKKVDHLSDLINEVENLFYQQEYDMANDLAKRVQKKIRNYRKCGLKKVGEYSIENLAFKLLRKNGFIDKLYDIRTKSYDKLMSLNPAKRDFADFMRKIHAK